MDSPTSVGIWAELIEFSRKKKTNKERKGNDMDFGGGWVREDPRGVRRTRMDLIKYGVNMYEILK